MGKKKDNNSKTWLRVVTLVLGLGFAASTAAIGLSGMFSQNNATSNVSESNNTANSPDTEAQIQTQIKGYEKVLEREPKNQTALQGLAQIYLQTGKIEKAIPVIEKLAAYYPEQPEYAGVLQVIKQQQAQQQQPAATPKTK
ncbi:MAG: tetratricopeptide repeat protein [Waterburya sp.]